MSTGIIYLAKNTINNKCYVGQTKRTLEIRKKQHLNTTTKADYKFARALCKYPESVWKWTVLAEVPVEELNEYEYFFINDLDSCENGYNTLSGLAWSEGGNPTYDPTVYELWHPEHGEIKETISELCKRHESFGKHFYLLVQGKRQHINGYILLKNKDNYDKIIKTYDFYHPEVGVVTCTTKQLFNNYRSCFKSTENRINVLTSGRVSIHHGWCLAKDKDKYKDLLSISSKITLTHKEHGTLTLKRTEWKEQYGIFESSMTYLLNGRYKSSRGWSLLETNDNPDRQKQIELLEPEIKECVEKLGTVKVKALKFVKGEIKSAMYNSCEEVTNAIVDNLKIQLIPGNFYSTEQLKSILHSEFKLLKVNKNIKGSLIEDYLNVKKTTKRVEGKVTSGYLVEN